MIIKFFLCVCLSLMNITQAVAQMAPSDSHKNKDTSDSNPKPEPVMALSEDKKNDSPESPAPKNSPAPGATSALQNPLIWAGSVGILGVSGALVYSLSIIGNKLGKVLDTVDTKGGALLAKAEGVVDKADKIAENAERITRKLDATMETINTKVVPEVHEMLKSVNEITETVKTSTLPEVNSALRELEGTTKDVRVIIGEVREKGVFKALKNGTGDPVEEEEKLKTKHEDELKKFSERNGKLPSATTDQGYVEHQKILSRHHQELIKILAKTIPEKKQGILDSLESGISNLGNNKDKNKNKENTSSIIETYLKNSKDSHQLNDDSAKKQHIATLKKFTQALEAHNTTLTAPKTPTKSDKKSLSENPHQKIIDLNQKIIEANNKLVEHLKEGKQEERK